MTPGAENKGERFVTDWQLLDPRKGERRPVRNGLGSAQYLESMAEASVVGPRKSDRWHGKSGSGAFELNPRLAAIALALLIGVGTLLWVGCKVMVASSRLAERHAIPITSELAE